MKNKLFLVSILFVTCSTFAQDFAEIEFLNSSRGLMIYADKISKKSTLYSTTDGGDSWTPILEAKSLKSIYQFNSNDIYVGYESTGIAYTTDGGSSWSYEDFGKEEAKVSRIQFAGSNYGWVCTYESVFITTNGGTTWTETGSEKRWRDALSIYLAGVDNGWFLKEDGEVYKFVNDSVSTNHWELIGDLDGKCYGPNAGIEFFDSLNGYAVGFNRTYKSTNGGYNWKALSIAAYQFINDYDFLNKDSFYLCGDNGIYFTDDGGESVDKIFSDGRAVLSIDFINASTGWAVTSEQSILKTTDGGQTWSGAIVASPSAPKILSVSDKPNDNGHYVVMRFERSNLDGLSNLENLQRYEIHRIEKSWLSLVKTVSPSQQEIYEVDLRTKSDSSSSSVNWEYYLVRAITNTNKYESNTVGGYSVDNLYPEAPVFLEGTFTEGNVELYWKKSTSEDVSNYEVFRSTNEQFTTDTMSVYAETVDTTFTDSSIPVNNTDVLYYKVFAVDSSGKRSEGASELGVLLQTTDVESNEIPIEFSLLQNYPNPFNPTTSIEYQVSSIENVKLTVYNTLGQKIKTLVNEQKSPGVYEVIFNASHLPSGFYFYTLDVEEKFISTRKMLLLK